MAERDPLYEEWGDLLHETPEAEKALREYREYRERQALEAVQRQLMKRRQREVQDAYDECRRLLREGRPED